MTDKRRFFRLSPRFARVTIPEPRVEKCHGGAASPGGQQCCWPAKQRASFDNFGNDKQAVRLTRSVRQCLLSGKPITRSILAENIEYRDGVGGRFYPGHIHLAQLF